MLALSAASQIDEYEIVVVTGGQPDAGTDVPVTFTLVGSGGRSVSTTIDPSQSSVGARPFRVNGKDTFKVFVFGSQIVFLWFVLLELTGHWEIYIATRRSMRMRPA